MRRWLRRHSAIWARFDPTPPVPTFPCDTCNSPLPVATDNHRIGTVWYADGPKALYCDGTET